MEQFDKRKVTIDEEVPTEEGWHYVRYNGVTIGEIIYKKNWKSVAMTRDRIRGELFPTNGMTRKKAAEGLCKYYFKEVEDKIKYYNSVLTLLNNKQD
jgi:hypothetical protein